MAWWPSGSSLHFHLGELHLIAGHHLPFSKLAGIENAAEAAHLVLGREGVTHVPQ